MFSRAAIRLQSKNINTDMSGSKAVRDGDLRTAGQHAQRQAQALELLPMRKQRQSHVQSMTRLHSSNDEHYHFHRDIIPVLFASHPTNVELTPLHPTTPNFIQIA